MICPKLNRRSPLSILTPLLPVKEGEELLPASMGTLTEEAAAKS